MNGTNDSQYPVRTTLRALKTQLKKSGNKSELLAELALDSNVDIKKFASKNPKTPESSLRDLARESSLGVRLGLAANPALPKDLLSQWVKTANRIVAFRLARRADLSASQLLELVVRCNDKAASARSLRGAARSENDRVFAFSPSMTDALLADCLTRGLVGEWSAKRCPAFGPLSQKVVHDAAAEAVRREAHYKEWSAKYHAEELARRSEVKAAERRAKIEARRELESARSREFHNETDPIDGYFYLCGRRLAPKVHAAAVTAHKTTKKSYEAIMEASDSSGLSLERVSVLMTHRVPKDKWSLFASTPLKDVPPLAALIR